jgi:NADPH:quinone reductase
MAEKMRAVGYRQALPISDPASLEDLEVPVPEPGPRDLLVRVEAVSVNPVDVKVRASSDPGGEPKILGYDAAGTVVATGSDVQLFAPGDEVYYAGSIDRPGTDAQFHVVDERITGHKPRSLTFAQAAALPLTTITAWEALFGRFRLNPESSGVLVVLGAAGGVGSMITQLTRALTRMVIIGTASRPESQQWVQELGAHHVIDHHTWSAGCAASPRTGSRTSSPRTRPAPSRTSPRSCGPTGRWSRSTTRRAWTSTR